jgi:hypothetical protein
MSVITMSDLLTTMVACGGPICIDARDHMPIHRALTWLANHCADASSISTFALTPDPEVGIRVRGVTQALWSLVSSGFFEVEESSGQAWFRVDPERLPQARRMLMRLSAEERAAIDHAAGIWAAACSTSRKKVLSPDGSSADTRRVSDAMPRQSSASARRHAAVSLISPA